MDNPRTWNKDAPLVIAHRGASSCTPENTMIAFRTAINLGADGIEVDVKFSRDGVPVIHHDMTVDRTTNGTGKVKDLTLSELKLLDAGSSFSPEFSGEQVPTLGELLEFARDGILLNLELTNYSTPLDQLPHTVIEMIEKAGLVESILISSFNPMNLIKVKRAKPNMRIALLVGGIIPSWAQGPIRKIVPYHDLNPHHTLIDETMVRTIHQTGGRVYAWTVNQYDRILTLLEMGVDGIITDDVEVGLNARAVYLNQ